MNDAPEGLIEFEARYGEECSLEIMEMMINAKKWEWIDIAGKQRGQMRVTSRESLDREGGNRRYQGEIKIGPRWWEFSVESGNWNGTVIEDWDRCRGWRVLPRNTLWIFMPVPAMVVNYVVSGKDRFLRNAWQNFLREGKEHAIWKTPIT